ncbi:MAG: helix-turn-helix domain-containing protein [Aldersonia sp.]|nr:helix-turn-helix domain-containing protein [Aldersonia sp.]
MPESAALGRRSPPTERVVAVLDFLVAHPGQRFGLSELARRLDVSKPTCLGIVTALADAGYLVRDESTRSYALGPALITAGRAAQEGFAVGPIARRQLADLSTRFHTTCTASGVIGDRITIVELTCPPDERPAEKVGQVYPFAPPVGLMYVLWSSDHDLEAWLNREPALPVRPDRERLDKVVRQCRRTGYLVETFTAMGHRLHRAMAGVVADDLPAELRALLGEMAANLGERVLLDDEDALRRPVSLLAAPTYDADARQALVITMHVGAAIDRSEIEARGAALTAAADAITAEVGGRRPARPDRSRVQY